MNPPIEMTFCHCGCRASFQDVYGYWCWLHWKRAS